MLQDRLFADFAAFAPNKTLRDHDPGPHGGAPKANGTATTGTVLAAKRSSTFASLLSHCAEAQGANSTKVA
jgi:hypothetical protein